MKATIKNVRNSQFKLVLDEPGIPENEKAVLACLDLYEGLGAWTLMDIRLDPHRSVSQWGSIGADELQCHLEAKNPEQAALIRHMLKESAPAQADQPLLVEWCSFHGITRGHRPSEMGLSPHFQHDYPVLFTRAQGLVKLKEIADFWAMQTYSPTDLDARKAVSSIKIPNPWLQPTESQMRFDLRVREVNETLQDGREKTSPKSPSRRSP